MEKNQADRVKSILLISDGYPTENFKRSGVFAYDEEQFYLRKGFNVCVLVLFRITIQKKNLFSPISELKTALKQYREIKAVFNNLPEHKIIPYFSFPKPLLYFHDLFLKLFYTKRIFPAIKFDTVIVYFMVHAGLNVSWIKKQFSEGKVILKELTDWDNYSLSLRKILVKQVRYYDKLFLLSNKSKKIFLDVFQKFGDTEHLPPIEIDYPKFNINNLIIKKQTGKGFKILSIANLIAAKGYKESFELLKIINASPLWHWTIIGKGDYLDTIIKLANSYGFYNNITVIPEVQKPVLYNYMKDADIYLQLTHRESFGIAPIEAYSYFNKLIVSAYIPSINELGLNNSNNVFIIKELEKIYLQKDELLQFIQQEIDQEEFLILSEKVSEKIDTINI